MAYRAVLPVLVITGFLGSGKTTLVNRVLQGAAGARLGVVVNDFGEIGIDGALIEENTDDVVELADGCLCCRNTGDLDAALAALTARADRLDGIVVETSGLADPTAAVEAVVRNSASTLVGVVTLVDCPEFDANLRHATVAYRQMVAADLFVLSKTALAPAAAELIPPRLALINAAAPVVRDRDATGAVASLLAPHAVPARRRVLGEHEHSALPAVTLAVPEPFDRVRFTTWIDGLGADVVRVKGLVAFAGGGPPLVVDRVGARTTFRLAPPSAGRVLTDNDAVLVLFGTGADRASKALAACTAAGEWEVPQ